MASVLATPPREAQDQAGVGLDTLFARVADLDRLRRAVERHEAPTASLRRGLRLVSALAETADLP